jgi:hypothetical protein
MGKKTWSLILRDEHKRRAFASRMLRGIFGLKREELRGGWRKLHNEELHNFYSSPNIIKTIISSKMRWAQHVAGVGKKRSIFKFWWGNLKNRDTEKI